MSFHDDRHALSFCSWSWKDVPVVSPTSVTAQCLHSTRSLLGPFQFYILLRKKSELTYALPSSHHHPGMPPPWWWNCWLQYESFEKLCLLFPRTLSPWHNVTCGETSVAWLAGLDSSWSLTTAFSLPSPLSLSSPCQPHWPPSCSRTYRATCCPRAFALLFIPFAYLDSSLNIHKTRFSPPSGCLAPISFSPLSLSCFISRALHHL